MHGPMPTTPRLGFAFLCLLLAHCHHIRSPTQEMVATMNRDIPPSGCASPDERTLVFEKGRAPYVMDVAEGTLRWQGEREESVVACHDQGVLVARAQGEGLYVALRDYMTGEALFEREFVPESCVGGYPYFSAWPRGELLGLEWRGHRFHRSGGPPPTPEEEAYWNACDGRGGIWLNPENGQWRQSERVREANHQDPDWPRTSPTASPSTGLRVEVAHHPRPVPDGCGGESIETEVHVFRGDTLLWSHILQPAVPGSAADSCIP